MFVGGPAAWLRGGLALEGDRYVARPSSRVLAGVTAKALMALLPNSIGLRDIVWIRSVRMG